MRAALRRELIVAIRRTALPVPASLVTLVLVMFVIVWRAGIPTLAPFDLYRQTVLVHRGLLLIVLPWVAHRSLTSDGPDDLATLGVLTTLDPRTILLARVLVIWLVLAFQIASALPALALAQQTSDVSWMALVADLLAPLGWAAAVAVGSVMSALLLNGALAPWAATTLATCGAAWLSGALPAALTGAAAAAVAVAGVAGIGAVGTRWSTWQGEHRAA